MWVSEGVFFEEQRAQQERPSLRQCLGGGQFSPWFQSLWMFPPRRLQAPWRPFHVTWNGPPTWGYLTNADYLPSVSPSRTLQNGYCLQWLTSLTPILHSHNFLFLISVPDSLRTESISQGLPQKHFPAFKCACSNTGMEMTCPSLSMFFLRPGEEVVKDGCFPSHTAQIPQHQPGIPWEGSKRVN